MYFIRKLFCMKILLSPLFTAKNYKFVGISTKQGKFFGKQMFHEAFGYFQQQYIARFVPVKVVELRKMVDIDKYDDGRGQGVEQLEQSQPIGKARQIIGIDAVDCYLLFLDDLRNIVSSTDKFADLPLFIEYRDDGRFHVAYGAVLFPVFKGAVPDLFVRNPFPHLPVDFV